MEDESSGRCILLLLLLLLLRCKFVLMMFKLSIICRTCMKTNYLLFSGELSIYWESTKNKRFIITPGSRWCDAQPRVCQGGVLNRWRIMFQNYPVSFFLEQKRFFNNCSSVIFGCILRDQISAAQYFFQSYSDPNIEIHPR